MTPEKDKEENDFDDVFDEDEDIEESDDHPVHEKYAKEKKRLVIK
jgi:hypothetical protein